MECPPLGPGVEDITWPDQVAPRGRKASSTRKIKPQTSNLKPSASATAVCAHCMWSACVHLSHAFVCPLHPPRIPMEGLTKNQWAQNVRRGAHLHSLNYCGGASPGVLYTPVARAESSQLGGDTHGLPIPICMCVHACVWFLSLDYPIPPGSLLSHGAGHPHVHLASGPLGCFPLWGGTSPLHSTQAPG